MSYLSNIFLFIVILAIVRVLAAAKEGKTCGSSSDCDPNSQICTCYDEPADGRDWSGEAKPISLASFSGIALKHFCRCEERPHNLCGDSGCSLNFVCCCNPAIRPPNKYDDVCADLDLVQALVKPGTCDCVTDLLPTDGIPQLKGSKSRD